MLLKNPEDKNLCAPNMFFVNAARDAWKQILKECTQGESVSVLVPSYIGETDREGSGVFDPIRELKCEFQFYEVSDRLTTNTEQVEEILKSESIDVLLTIHYFGFVHADLKRLRTLCDKHHVKLVEDCAHICSLHSILPGTVGDYSFYSLHKFLPTDVGGVLRVNGQHNRDFQPSTACPVHVLEQLARTNLHEAAELRRRNYMFLYNAMAATPGLSAMYELDTTTIPHNFPIMVHNDRREELYFHLQKMEIQTMGLYYRLASEIEPAAFPVSHYVSDNILNLPIHQDVTEKDLQYLTIEIQKFMNSQDN